MITPEVTPEVTLEVQSDLFEASRIVEALPDGVVTMAAKGGMMQPKWHYTTKAKLESMLRDGVIKLGEIDELIWFTKNDITKNLPSEWHCRIGVVSGLKLYDDDPENSTPNDNSTIFVSHRPVLRKRWVAVEQYVNGHWEQFAVKKAART